jgi:uncharacterized RDD family membrane protein YckC
VAAWLIDGLILSVVSIPAGISMGGFDRMGRPSALGPGLLTLSTVAQWLYFALLESSSKQATVGKMALGIRVTDLDGRRITFGRATGRHFGKILSGLILGIGFLMAAFTERKQALHDMLAGTLVVR